MPTACLGAIIVSFLSWLQVPAQRVTNRPLPFSGHPRAEVLEGGLQGLVCAFLPFFLFGECVFLLFFLFLGVRVSVILSFGGGGPKDPGFCRNDLEQKREGRETVVDKAAVQVHMCVCVMFEWSNSPKIRELELAGHGYDTYPVGKSPMPAGIE